MKNMEQSTQLQKDSNAQLEEVLSSLDLPLISRKIYMRLLGNKSLNARMLAETLDIPRPSVYDHIRILQDKNLIIPKKQDGKLFFSANDPHHIQSLINLQESKYKEMKKVFGNLLPKLQADSSSSEPRIQFFNGISGIKSIFSDILWLKDSETYVLWANQNILNAVDQEYQAWHSKRMAEQNITVRMNTLSIDLHSNISMSYWIYGDKVAFFDLQSATDSPAELYGFIVHSKSFSNLMKMQFDILLGILK